MNLALGNQAVLLLMEVWQCYSFLLYEDILVRLCHINPIGGPVVYLVYHDVHELTSLDNIIGVYLRSI